MPDLTLELHHTGKMGRKGEILEVHFNGEVIASGISPELNACRVLKERGFTGTAYFQRPGKPTWDLKVGIEWGSAHTVSETDRTGLRFGKWVPFKMAETV